MDEATLNALEKIVDDRANDADDIDRESGYSAGYTSHGNLMEIAKAAYALGQSARPEGAFRNAVLDECLAEINKWIKPGDLPGNGCDQTAQRGGMVIAYNLLFALRHPK